MKSVLIFILFLYSASCVKTPTKAEIDCGGCGLKSSGKKYQKIKKQERRK